LSPPNQPYALSSPSIWYKRVSYFYSHFLERPLPYPNISLTGLRLFKRSRFDFFFFFRSSKFFFLLLRLSVKNLSSANQALIALFTHAPQGMFLCLFTPSCRGGLFSPSVFAVLAGNIDFSFQCPFWPKVRDVFPSSLLYMLILRKYFICLRLTTFVDATAFLPFLNQFRC